MTIRYRKIRLSNYKTNTLRTPLIITLFLLLLFPEKGISQLVVDVYPTEEFMITNMLMGDSSTKIWNVQFQGAHESRGVFYAKNTVIPIKEGLILTTGNAKAAAGPNKGSGFTGSNRTKGDQDLHFIANYKTYDATVISFEFEATYDLVRFNYIFASEEYPEYVGSTFNDVFGFFLTNLETGEVTNLAVIPNSTKPITVNNINHVTHSNFYIPNSKIKSEQIEFDGLTTPLIAYSEVTPGSKYRIKIAIADVGDDAFDSGVFLQGKSFKSELKTDFYRSNTQYFDAFKDDQISQKNTLKTETSEVVLAPKKSELKEENTTSSKMAEKKKMVNKKTQDSIIVYFDFDKSVPNSTELKRIEEQLNLIPVNTYSVTLKGHTDQVGSNRYNQQLSENRAQYVSSWLTKNYQANILVLKGYSYNQLAQTQTTPSARTKNRRVVILFEQK